jgi:membrane protein
MNLKTWPALASAGRVLRDAATQWMDAKAQRMGAALSFYAVISLAPLLVLVVAVAGFFLGPEAAGGQLALQIQGTVGRPVANALQGMIQAAQSPRSNAHTIIGLVVLLFGASGVFAELQDSMNTIWQVTPKPGRALLTILRDRFLSFAMIMSVCFLLLASLVVTAALAALARWWTPSSLPGGAWLWQGLNFAVSFLVITLLFALILKVLPDARVLWKDVWVGAAVTALLFTLGKLLLALYLARSSVTSGYGAAGSLVVVLLWIYYAAQIVLFGAAFTHAYALRFSGGIQPAPNAVRLTPADRALQGIPTSSDIQAAEAAHRRA